MNTVAASGVDVVVVGCGVSGLTCGIRLLQAKFPVTIVARELPPHTTSDVAAAIWYPYLAYPVERVLEWGRVTFDELYRLMTVSEAGVKEVTFVEVFERPVPDPWWKNAVHSFRRPTANELPPGYQDGYVVDVPLLDTPIYMQYLIKRFCQLGGRVVQESVVALPQLYQQGRLIVNCSGIGAREIAGDSAVYPIRGQIIRVKTAALERSIVDQTGRLALTYVISRNNDCILGGTAEENEWSLDINVETSQDIMRKCQQLVPDLVCSTILEHRVGLRPGRKEVRVELERVWDRCAVIHNYGHGGAGFTLSWGCANEVADLAQKISEEMVA